MDGRRQRTMNNPGIMGALTPSDRKNMGRQNLPFHSAQSMNRVTGAVQRPESFTNLNMLGRPDLSFRYSHMGPSEGMGVGGTGETRLSDYTTRDGETIRGTWRKVDDARRADEMDEYGYLEGAPRQRTNFYEGYISPQAFNEMYGGVYDDAIFRTVDPYTNRIEQFPMPDSPNLMERPILPRDFVPEFEPPILPRDFEVGPMQPAAAAVDPSDWRTILKILEAGGDPQTETAGIMGAMPQERQMAELTDAERLVSNDLMGTNWAIDSLNTMYDLAIQDGSQREADAYLRDIQSLMGTLPRAARGGLMSLRK